MRGAGRTTLARETQSPATTARRRTGMVLLLVWSLRRWSTLQWTVQIFSNRTQNQGGPVELTMKLRNSKVWEGDSKDFSSFTHHPRSLRIMRMIWTCWVVSSWDEPTMIRLPMYTSVQMPCWWMCLKVVLTNQVNTHGEVLRPNSRT